MAVKVRELTAEERSTIERLAGSRTEPARTVERARMVWHASQGLRVNGIARRLGCSAGTARQWVKRFNANGLAGLNDLPRPGGPSKFTPEQKGEVIAAALSKPESLGLPFACWTLDRLTAYLKEERGIPISRSRVDEILAGEGLRWLQQETWFGERVDPQFAEKRGSSPACTPSPRREA